MNTDDRPADGARRCGRAAALVLLAGLAGGLGACRSVTVAPQDASWVVTGAGKETRASWRQGVVEVTVPLDLADDATMLTGSVANAGPPAHVSFAVPPSWRLRTWIGTVSGGAASGRWSATIVPGTPVELPAGTPDAPGTLDFALRPDMPWGADDLPDIDSKITWDVAVASPAGDVVCPIRFRVAAARPGLWSNANIATAVTIAAAIAVLAWV